MTRFGTGAPSRLRVATTAAVLLLMGLVTSGASAQVNVTATVGTPSASYATLKLAFDAVNAGTQGGVVTIDIAASTTEGTTPATLNSSGTGSASYTSVLIQPTTDGVSISGNPAQGFGVIQLNGADNVTIDGDNPNTGGTNRNLTVANTATATTTYNSVIRVATASTTNTTADNNTIRNCILNGSATGRNASGATSTTGSENTTFGVLVGPNGSVPPAAPTAVTSVSGAMATGTTANAFAVDNCAVNQCARGIVFLGTATSSSTSVSITNNLVGDQVTSNVGVTPPYTTPATTVYTKGILIQGTAAVTVTGNTVKNLLSYVGTTMSAIELTSAIGATANVNNNTVTTVGQNASASAIRGILVSSSAGPTTNVNGNVITNLQHMGTSNARGIDVTYLGTTTGSLSKNSITTVRNRNSGGYGAVGIYITGGGGWNINDNSVVEVLNVGTSSFTGSFNCVGIKLAAGLNHKVYHNSVNLFGASTSTATNSIACLEISASSQTGIDIRNNNFSNKVTGGNASEAIVCLFTPFANAAMTLTQNNNAYFSTVGTQQGIAFAGSSSWNVANLYTAANFNPGATTPATNYRSVSTVLGPATNDNASFASTTAAPFVSNTDLHIPASTATPLESGGVAGLGIVTDYDGQTFGTLGTATAPDIGFDEFAGTAPPSSDIAASAFVDPTNGGSKLAGVSFSPQASFSNLGLAAQTNIPVRYRVVGPAPSMTEIYNDPQTIASLSAGATTTVTFTSTSFSAGTYTIYAASELPGDQTPANDQITGTFEVLAPLCGTYQVGTGQPAPFNTLTGAVGRLNNLGVSCAVVFELAASSYTTPAETFPIVINAIPGASATNTITIRPAAGQTPTISGSLASGALIKLNGADYVTIDGSNSGGTDRSLTITNSATTAPCAVWLASLGNGSGATDDVVKNCNINTNSATGATAYGISVSGATIGSAGGDNDNVTIQNNAFSSSNIGVYANGNAAVSTGGMDNLAVAGNSFTASTTLGTVYGVQIGAALNASVTGNTINLTTTATGQPVGISIETNTSNSSVTSNQIQAVVTTATGGYGARGITVGTGTTGSNITVANNFVAGVNGSNYTSFSNSSSMGIGLGVLGNGSLTTTTGGVNLYHNSVNMAGTYSYSAACLTAGLYVGSAASALNIQNNILVNTLTNTNAGGTLSKNYAVYSVAANTAYAAISYNDYYVAGTQGVLGYLGADQTTLAAFNTAFTGNPSTPAYNVTPSFTSPTNLHIPAATTTLLESGGVGGTGIAVDVDNEVRPGPPGSVNGGATANDVGADEFDGTPVATNDMAATAFVDPTNGGTKSVGVAFAPQASFTNLGLAAQTNVTVRYRIVGPSPDTTTVYNQTAVIASIASTVTTTVTFPGATLTSGGSYAIYARAELVGDQSPANDQITGTLSALAPLSGDYTVGLLAFRQISGVDLTFERQVRKVTRAILEPVDPASSPRGDNPSDLSGETAFRTVLREVEEVTWVPMANGRIYERPLRVDRVENPDLPADAGRGVYATITAAVADLNLRGVGGPVRFLLNDGTYPSETLPIVINVTAAPPTATNTVTIKPNSGVTPTVSGASASGPIFKIFRTDYVAIDGSNCRRRDDARSDAGEHQHHQSRRGLVRLERDDADHGRDAEELRRPQRHHDQLGRGDLGRDDRRQRRVLLDHGGPEQQDREGLHRRLRQRRDDPAERLRPHLRRERAQHQRRERDSHTRDSTCRA